ncbi:MAG: hypothetical protein ABJO09_14175 [Hyphomicrobiales bacterium]
MNKSILLSRISAFCSIFILFFVSISWVNPINAEMENLTPPLSSIEGIAKVSIFKNMNIDAPGYVKNIIKNKKTTFSAHIIQEKIIYVFYEGMECPSYGCAIISMSIEGNRFFDPVIIYSKNEMINHENRNKLLFFMGK